MKDKYGNEYEPPTQVRLDSDKCEIINCHSNGGFSCTLSVYDHKDAVRPDRCAHRKFTLRDKKK